MELLIIPYKQTNKMKATNDQLIESYKRTHSIWKTAKEFNMCGQSVHERLVKLNIIHNDYLTDTEKKKIIDFYKSDFKAGDLENLSKELKRNKQVICRFSKSQGLTKKLRLYNDELKNKISEGKKGKIVKNFTFLGKHHTIETKEKISKNSKLMWNKMTQEEKDKMITKQLKARLTKYGNLVPNREKCSWKAGWREIGGKRKFFRSRWEANYARYLEFLKQHNEIKEWQHESKTFWFENIKRGCRSYLPDFEITNNDGSIEFHEVKGWFDDRSKTKLKRMQKYYPDVKLIVIFRKQYEEIKNKVSGLIIDWE